MPTGYTAGVADGTISDFKTFALQCARSFGACILQRDESPEQPPRLREVSEYYRTAVEKAKQRQVWLAGLTLWDAQKEAEREHEEAVASYQRREIERTETRNRYNEMLAEVMGWQPPTPDHARLRKFMIDQLTESRQFDCSPYGAFPQKISGERWLQCERERADQESDRATQSLGEEMERVEKANGWITALYTSLKAEPVNV